MRELLDLFALARFSSHPISEQHRVAAVRAMRAALASTSPGAGVGTKLSVTPAQAGVQTGFPLPRE